MRVYIPTEEAHALSTAGTEITLTLDRENNTIKYGINDKEYDAMKFEVKLDRSRYRLVINFNHQDNAIELL